LSDIVILIDSINDIEKLKEKISQNTKIFTFNFNTHNILTKEKIHHEIADRYVSESDRLKIFDIVYAHYRWYEKIPDPQNLELEGVNLLSILDTAELHQHLLNGLLYFLTIKKIIEKENPQKIICTQNLLNIVNSIILNTDIVSESYSTNQIDYLAWDRIEIKFNIGKMLISFHISRKMYARLKDAFESILCNIFNLWNGGKKNPTILLLEFNPQTFKDLLVSLAKQGTNILLYNRRRPAISDYSTITLLRKTKSKMFNFKKVEHEMNEKIQSLTSHYCAVMRMVFSHDEYFERIFTLENSTYWYAIKDNLVKAYNERITEYISLLLVSKGLFEKTNISCIASLNVVGETEKSILYINNGKIPSIMLEHGYANWLPETSNFDVLSMYSLANDKIAVWGEPQKKYLTEYKKLASDRILVSGSTKHDHLFYRQPVTKINPKKTVLLTLHPITQITGQATIDLYVEFEKSLIKFCEITSSLGVNLIVKLHPSQDSHNENIKELFRRINPRIPVYQMKSITKLIEISDVLVTLSPEGFDPSTVILDALIQNKPVMNIVLDNKFYEFEYVKDNAVLVMSPDSNIELDLKKILFDDKFRHSMIENGKIHVKNYLSNAGNASETLAKIMNTL